MSPANSNKPDVPENPAQHEPIAIIGIGCRYPGGVVDLDSFWRLLKDGVDAISEAPADRFDQNLFFDPVPYTPGKVITRKGGFLSDRLDQFDPALFNISPREATMMDPQQRLLLETSWEAFENAGLPLERIAGSRTSVFVGMWTNEYEDRIYQSSNDVDLYVTTGGGRYAASGRLSYVFDLQGPSLTLDTACSSSLVALHLAIQSLRKGETDMALVGATNLILVPHISIGYSKSKMLSPDALCKFADASANGYVRSEGVGVVILKPLTRALQDGDPIHALILGSAINNDGHGSGLLVAPSGDGQTTMLRDAYRDANILPSQVGYIEAHGTGTPVGDPVELQALSEVLREGRPADQPCAVGSVKTNIGHAEAASGMAGLIKAVLCLKHRAIPASLHFHKPNPRIDWDNIPFYVQNSYGPWPGYAQPLIAGVNSFGVTGTNAHLVLQEAPPVSEAQATRAASNTILPISAQSLEALRALAARYAAMLAETQDDLSEILYTASQRRSHLTYRLAVPAKDKTALIAALNAYAQNDPLAPVTTGKVNSPRKIAFVFPGQGGQWLGMGRQLYHSEPAFREAIDHCEAAIRPFVDWSLVEQLHTSEADSRLAEIDVVQPVLFAVEVALAETWRAWGVEPDAVVGHSMGEAAAAYISGALSLEDAARVICTRSRLMKRVSGKGGMAVVELTLEQAQAALAGYEDRLSIAVSNGPRASVISGDPAALEEVSAQLHAKGVFVRPVKVDVAAHSPHMDGLRPELVQALESIQPQLPAVPVYSTVSGALATAPLDAAYWGSNLRSPVLFSTAVEQLVQDGYSIFIECSPHPVLLAAIEQNSQADLVTVASMRRGEDEHAQMLAGLSRVYCEGGSIRWERMYPGGRCVALPTYPFQRERYWAKEAELGAGSGARPSTRLLNAHFEIPDQPGVQIWQASLSLEMLPYLADHKVNGAVLLPAAAFVELALEAAASSEVPLSIDSLVISEALPLRVDETSIVQVRIDPDRTFEIASRSQQNGDWTHHARGVLRPAQATGANFTALDAPEQPGSDHVAAMHARGLDYGPAFQAVTSFQRSENLLTARLRLPAGLPVGELIVHPSVLDACFQLMMSTIDAGDGQGDPFLPVKIGALTVFARPRANSALVAHITRRSDPGANRMVGDIRLQDEQGNLLLAVDGLEMQRWHDTAHQAGKLAYTLDWMPAAELPLPGPAAGHWYIAADDTATAAALDGELRALGATCSLQSVSPLPADVRDVIFLAANRAPEPAAAEAQSARLLDCIQTLATREWNKPPRLWVVTLGAQAVVDGESPSPALAALWGLAATAAHEYPAWRVTRVDLDSLTALPDLTRELLAGQHDPVALRGGKRFAAQLASATLDAPATAKEHLAPADGQPFRLEIAQPGLLDTLALRAAPRPRPGPGQVEIEVRAAGLNFIDTLKGLGLYPGMDNTKPARVGLECAGVVTAMGKGVQHLRPGQEVLAFAPNSFSTHVLADARLVAPKPASISFEQAATFPVVFLTTYYALCYLGRMRRGERVLVHSAAGGVGLAAIQLAKHVGAEVFATAGSEEKRAYLRDLGVRHIMDSRSLDFAGQIMEATGGEGVDLVLNSLTGEAIHKGLSVLAPYGRFLEIGKRDIYQNTRIGLFPFQKNLSYFAIDLDRMARERPELLGEILGELLALLEQGAIQPLPLQVYTAAQAGDAFRAISRATHIGKIVVQMAGQAVDILPAREDSAPVKPDASYLITGGFGALGLTMAGWLAQQGARHLALVGRTGEQHLSDAARASLEALRASGVEVQSFAADLSDMEQAESVLTRMRAGMPALRGVIHAAGVLDDGILAQQSAARIHTTFAPKAAGAWNLHCLTDGLPLDFFILFSSISAPFGSPGQANYAAANAYLDGLAQQRRAAGLPALSINWGPWAQIGLAAARQQGGLQGLAGLRPLEPEDGLEVFGRLMGIPHAQVIVSGLNASEWQSAHPASAHSSLFNGLAGQIEKSASAAESSIRASILAAEPGRQRRSVLENFIQAQAAAVLRLPPARVDVQKPLRSLGLDSLMGIEFRNRLESNLDVTLSATLVWNYPTVSDLVPFLAEKMGIALDQAQADVASVEIEAQPPLSPDLEGLSDDDLAAMLDDELDALDDLL